MRQKLAVLFVITIFTSFTWADNSPVTSYLPPDTQPQQQFVTADQATMVTATASAAAANINTGSAVATPDIPPPTATTPPPVSNASQAATPLGMGDKTDNPPSVFVGGLDIPSFVKCNQMATAICQQTTSIPMYQSCIDRLKARGPVCKQFLAFSVASGMGPRDNIDVIKHYKEADLDLIHLQRFGANYPGVYYSIGASGDFQDLIFGAPTQSLDIRKAVQYPEIASKYPNVQLFSVVEKLPQTAPTPNGNGVRLILQFTLFNGCHACEIAGYADVAYDFSDNGTLQQTSIISLTPSS